MSATPLNCFLTFADSRMEKALQRIKSQAGAMQYFDKIYALNELDLPADFVEKWGHVLIKGSRGYGYWIWKPYLIWKILESLPEGSTLLYCDAGSHLNPKGKKRLIQCYTELRHDKLGIKAFGVSCILLASRKEKHWTKGDIFKYFNCENRPDITETDQIEATTILFKKNDEAVDFVREWYKVAAEHFFLLDDSPSQSPNFSGFVENRHDQSLFSVLFKLHSGKALSAAYSVPAILSNPIWHKRDKGLPGPRKGFSAKLKFFIKCRIIYCLFRIRHMLSNS